MDSIMATVAGRGQLYPVGYNTLPGCAKCCKKLLTMEANCIAHSHKRPDQAELQDCVCHSGVAQDLQSGAICHDACSGEDEEIIRQRLTLAPTPPHDGDTVTLDIGYIFDSHDDGLVPLHDRDLVTHGDCDLVSIRDYNLVPLHDRDFVPLNNYNLVPIRDCDLILLQNCKIITLYSCDLGPLYNGNVLALDNSHCLSPNYNDSYFGY
ncbi:hypothetical protein CFE70_005839 [Pyrenophora teres f. teres 0-1]